MTIGIKIRENLKELPLKSDKERKCEDCRMLELCKKVKNPALKLEYKNKDKK